MTAAVEAAGPLTGLRRCCALAKASCYVSLCFALPVDAQGSVRRTWTRARQSVVYICLTSPTLCPAGAQCAHAAVGVIGMYKNGNEVLFRQWERHGQPKIALKVKDDVEMVRRDRQQWACM